jgi:hypothetical protein
MRSTISFQTFKRDFVSRVIDRVVGTGYFPVNFNLCLDISDQSIDVKGVNIDLICMNMDLICQQYLGGKILRVMVEFSTSDEFAQITDYLSKSADTFRDTLLSKTSQMAIELNERKGKASSGY